MDDPDEVLPDLRNQMFIAPTFFCVRSYAAYDETELRCQSYHLVLLISV